MSLEKILKCENCGDRKSIKKKIEEGINVGAQRFGSTPYSDVKNDINNYLYRGVDPENYLTDLSDEKKIRQLKMEVSKILGITNFHDPNHRDSCLKKKRARCAAIRNQKRLMMN